MYVGHPSPYYRKRSAMNKASPFGNFEREKCPVMIKTSYSRGRQQEPQPLPAKQGISFNTISMCSI